MTMGLKVLVFGGKLGQLGSLGQSSCQFLGLLFSKIDLLCPTNSSYPASSCTICFLFVVNMLDHLSFAMVGIKMRSLELGL